MFLRPSGLSILEKCYQYKKNWTMSMIAMLKAGIIVGHVPREVSRIFTFFIRHGGTIVCEVVGHRKLGKGLEVPCCYKFTGKPKHIKKALKLLYPSTNKDLSIDRDREDLS